MTVAEAGGIVARIERGTVRYLLVTAKRNPEHWLFPKGRIEPRETAADAALREAREEAGVDGTVLAPLGWLEFRYGRDDIQVQIFLIDYRGDIPAREHRQRRWCTYEEAIELLSFDNARQLLRKSQPAIREHLDRTRSQG